MAALDPIDITPSTIELNFVPITSTIDPSTGEVIMSDPNGMGGIAPSVPAPSSTNISPAANGSVLTSGSFRSPNYSPGNSGWKIDANGDVEFASGKFRGEITGASGVIGGFTIGSTTLTATGLVLDAGNQRILVGSNVTIDAATGQITVGASGSTILIDGANKVIKSSNYSAGVSGFIVSPDLIETQNLHARGMLSTTVFQKDVISAVGGQLLVSNADILDADMTALDASTLTITAASSFSVNDILHIKDALYEEYLRVTAIGSAPTYSVTRDLAGAYASNSNPVWKKGTAVVVEGSSDGVSAYSGGFLRLLGSGANSPYYSVFMRSGIAYGAESEVVRLGNLNGTAAFVSATYGIFLGNYASGQYLTYDSVSGNLIVNGTRLTNESEFGNGSDGNVTISVDTTLTQDMFYDTLTVNAGKTLNTGGYRIFCRTELINNGTIKNAGGNASGQTGGIAAAGGSLPAGLAGVNGGNGQGGQTAGGGFGSVGSNGTSVAKANGVAGVAGVAGAAGGSAGLSGGTGGGAGTAGILSSTPLNIIYNTIAGYLWYDGATQHGISGVSGGSGGGGAGSGTGGGGGASGDGGAGAGSGAPGGVVWISAKKITNGTGALITAPGGNGGIGANGGNSSYGAGNSGGGGGGGGGSAGSGGVVFLKYSVKSNLGTISAPAGTPGTGGTGGNGTGSGATGNAGPTGNTANAGKVIEIVI